MKRMLVGAAVALTTLAAAGGAEAKGCIKAPSSAASRVTTPAITASSVPRPAAPSAATAPTRATVRSSGSRWRRRRAPSRPSKPALRERVARMTAFQAVATALRGLPRGVVS